eukprot:m.26646 g.26646  ORF g.26646 m.26646 type:complete len:663 (+) comp5874_c0_seq1:47-2035(+)
MCDGEEGEEALAVGSSFTYMKLCHLVTIAVHAQGREFKVKAKDSKRVRLQCPAGKDCKFCVYAKPSNPAALGDSICNDLAYDDDFNSKKKHEFQEKKWTIVLLDLNHTCAGDVKRKKNYHIKFIQANSNVIDSFHPADGDHRGANKHLRAIVKNDSATSTKHTLTRRQASSYLQRVTNSSLSDAIAQYHFLVSFLKRMQRVDPSGTYIYTTTSYPTQAGSMPRLHAYYVCPFSSKEFMKHSRHVVVIDAVALNGPLRGVLLTATAKDANNHLRLLAWSQIPSESSNAWFDFISQMHQDIGDEVRVLLMDGEKGLESCATHFPHVQFCHSASHIYEMLQKQYRMGDEGRCAFWGMAKACTREEYLHFHDLLFQESEGAAEVAHKLKDRYARFVFLPSNPRFGDTATSSMAMAESFNVIFKPSLRKLPVLDLNVSLLLHINNEAQHHVTTAASLLEQAMTLTPVARHIVNRAKVEAEYVQVYMTTFTASELGATVVDATHILASFEITIKRLDAGAVFIQCPCVKWAEFGLPCKHVLATLMKGEELKGEVWSFLDMRWYSKVWHVSTFKQQYEHASTRIPPLVFSANDKSVLLPPPTLVGANVMPTRSNDNENPRKRPVTCRSCGEAGHKYMKCPLFDTATLALKADTHQSSITVRPLSPGLNG